MGSLSEDQVRELITFTEQKQENVLAEYNRLTGFIKALKLFDGSTIIEDENGEDPGDGCPVADGGGEPTG